MDGVAEFVARDASIEEIAESIKVLGRQDWTKVVGQPSFQCWCRGQGHRSGPGSKCVCLIPTYIKSVS